MHRPRFFLISSVVVSFVLCLNASYTRAQSFVYNRALFTTGAQPVGVVMADFNGDGRLDLAVANSNDTTISILLGKPDGTVAPKVDLTVSRGPLNVIAADFNGDGKMDIAATYGSSSSTGVIVILGKGDGTFQSPVNYSVLGTFAYGLAAADLNHDGKLDLVVADGGVSVLLGNGNGTFKSATAIPATTTGANWVTVADLNGDGDPDLAVTLGGAFQSPNYALILLGNGDGTFQSGEEYGTGYDSNSIAAADFNGDGKLDLVVSSLGEIDLLLGNGDGTFQTPTPVPDVPGTSATMVFAADFNHDNKMDFAVPSGGRTYVFLGNGDGTFQFPTETLAGTYQSGFALGDINGDGSVDVAQTDLFNNQVAILLGNGDGTFGPVLPLPSIPFYQSFPFTIGVRSGAIADFTGDGKPDLALAAGTYYYDQGGLVVFPGHGDGTLGTPAISNFYTQVLSPADFNEDGKMDLAFSDGNGAGVALSNGDGTFGSVTQLYNAGSTPALQIVTGDFNNDTHADVVAFANCSSGEPCIYVSLGNGNGTFQNLAPFWTSPPFLTGISAADFNRDGKLDLVLTFNPSGFAILLGNGDGTFKAPVSYLSPELSSATTADLNHDGKPELLLTDSANGQIDVYLGNGTTTLGTPKAYSSGQFPNSITTGDFNGDGKLDVAVLLDSGVSILYGNGDGSLQAPILFNVTNAAGPLTVGDFNQDGLTDILVGGNNGALVMPRPIASFFPAAVNFGSQIQGTTSASKNVTVTNVGLVPVKISQVSASADFGVVSQCGATLQKGATCTIGVTFAPSAPGLETGTLVLQDNTPLGAQAIPLMGVGTGPSGQLPAGSLAPTSLTFSGQAVGTSSPSQTVTLSNTGNATLTIDNIATTGDFSQTNNCGLTLSAGASCAIHLTFAPLAGRRRAGTLTVTDNSVNNPQIVVLSGLGVSGHISLASSAVDFGSQFMGTTSLAKSATVSNTGSVPLSITGIAISGNFSLVASGTTCSTSTPLGANSSCVIQMTFSPPSTGYYTGTLILTDNDDGVVGSTQSVVLTGTGTNSAVSLSTNDLSFPVQLVGTSSSPSTITVTNTASSVLSISGVTVTGDFTQTNNCGSGVAVGGNCTISVTFSPSTSGRIFGSVIINIPAANVPQNVTLDGYGEDLALTVHAGSTTSATVSAGVTATYAIDVGEVGIITPMSASFTCSGAPAYSSCTVSPNPLRVGSVGGITVSVATQAASQGVPQSNPRNIPTPPARGITELLLLSIGLSLVVWAFRLGSRRGRQRWGLSLLPLAAGIALLFILSGCGGGSGGGGGGGGIVHNPGTPTGNYTLTVTGTATIGASKVDRTMNLTLKVN